MDMHDLKVCDITKKIKDNEILKNVSFELQGGKIYGFIGKNGAGKTMLFRIISSLVHPTEGNVYMDGQSIFGKEYKKSIGVILENTSLWPDLTAYENLLYLSELKRVCTRDDIVNALERVGLDPLNKLPIKKYSLGMRQRLIVAQAIMEKPDLILLDEPTNAIDSDGIELVYNIVKEEAGRGAIVLIASHVKQDISSLCNEVYEMNQGICRKIEGLYEK